jgi:hypothetical protein
MKSILKVNIQVEIIVDAEEEYDLAVQHVASSVAKMGQYPNTRISATADFVQPTEK